jgi:hypothetical protein
VPAAKGPPANWIVIPIKVFTGEVPFKEFLPATSAAKIMQGKRPPRPVLTDDVWALMEMCWDQEPRSRPETRRLLQDLASSLLRSLRQSLPRSTESSPEFQVALGQFYDNTERKRCMDRLHNAELREFVNFLDDVRSRLSLLYLNPGCDFSNRCCVSRD